MSCGNPDCTGCDGADIDATIADIVRNKRHFAVVPLVERPHYVFTVGLEELYGQPEVLMLANDMDLNEAAACVSRIGNMVANGQVHTSTEGPVPSTRFRLTPLTQRSTRKDARQLMGSATRFYRFGPYRITKLEINDNTP